MYKQILKSGVTALAGFAVNKMLKGFEGNPIKVAESHKELFSTIESLEEFRDQALEAFEQNYSEDSNFDDLYIGTFEDFYDVGGFLIAEDHPLDFLSTLDPSEALMIAKDPELLKHEFVDHLMSNGNLNIYHNVEDDVYHAFSGDY